MDMDRYEGINQRGRSKLSRFRVRRDPSVESGERQVRNDFEGSLRNESQDGLRDGSAPSLPCKPNHSRSPSIALPNSSYPQCLDYSLPRSRSPASPRPSRPLSPSPIPLRSHSLPATPPLYNCTSTPRPFDRVKLYLPLPSHLPSGILSDYFESLFPPIKVYSLKLHATKTTALAFVVVDRELWENGEIEKRVQRSEGLWSRGKEWIVRLSLAKGEHSQNGLTNLDRSGGKLESERKDHGWVRIELTGFPMGTKRQSVEVLLGRHLKFWNRFEMNEERGWARFEVKGMKPAGVVERNLEGLRTGSEGEIVRVRIERDEERLAGDGKLSSLNGEEDGRDCERMQEIRAKTSSPDSYQRAQSPKVSEREGSVGVEEKPRRRETSHRRERGRSRSRSTSSEWSNSRSSSRESYDRGRRRRGRDRRRKESRNDGLEDEEGREQRRSRRKRGIKKQSSHRTPSCSLSRSRSPLRGNYRHHRRYHSRSRSRSTSPRHRRHRKTSRRSPSSSPIRSRATRQRSRYDSRSRSSSTSPSPRRRERHDKRSIAPLSLQRHNETNHHSLGPSSQYPPSAQTPHYDERYGHPISMHPNLGHFQQFPPPPPPPHYQPHPTFTSTPPVPPPFNYFSQPTPLASYPIQPNYIQPRLPPNQSVYTRFPSAPSPNLTIYTPTTHYERSQIAENTIRQITENLERNRERNRLAARELRGQGEGRYSMGYRE